MADTMERRGSRKMSREDEVISDETFETMLDALDEQANDTDVSELLQVMNENRIISREEAEQILEVGGPNTIVKCGLPPHVRPSDPENSTDAEDCVSRLLKNDPTLVEVNLNNMKRTPIPVIQRMLMALKTNTYLKRLMLANTGLSDTGAEPLLETLEENSTLESLNIETNFLSGDFLAKLFKAALKNQTLREIKAVNQSPTFSTESEMEIMKAVHSNRGLTKVSVNLRHPEAKNKIELACLRNGELKRQQRRLEQLMKQQQEAENAADGPVQNNIQKPAAGKTASAASKPAEKKQTDKPMGVTPVKRTPAKKETDKQPENTVTSAGAKKEQNAAPAKPAERKATEKETVGARKSVFEKKATESEKPPEKEKPVLRREFGKKPVGEEKEKAVNSTAPPPPPAPIVNATNEAAPPSASEKQPTVKPTLGMAAKEAAAKAASRGFGESGTTTPLKKKTSIGERSKPMEEVKPLETMSSATKTTRPGTLNVANKDIPTSKGLGAATFGSTPKPPTPSKAEPPKRRGSGTMKPPTPSTPTPKSETASKPWSSAITKPPGSSAVGKASDVKSKIDAFSAKATETKPKPVTYGYGGGKKRDSMK